MLDKIIMLIGEAANGQDELIQLMINQAKQFILLYCGISEYNSKYDSVVIKMVIEDWNKRGSEGLAARSFSGMSESFTDAPYSSGIMTFLDSAKKSTVSGVKFL